MNDHRSLRLTTRASTGNPVRPGRWTLSRILNDLRNWTLGRSLGFWILLIAAVLEAVILSWFQWQNFLSFLTWQGDAGNYSQAFFTTLHGEGFFAYTTNAASGSGGTIWAIHFSPFLVLLLPFYALAPSPVTLFALKQAALALAALPLYGIARVYFRTEAVCVAIGLVYLLSPITLSQNWNSFDPESFAPLLIFLAFYFFLKGRFWPFLCAWLLAASTIEAVPALLAASAAGGLIGVYLFPSTTLYWTAKQQRRPLWIALVASLVWLGLAALELYAVGTRGGGFGDGYAVRYTTLQARNLPSVLIVAISHPARAVAALQVKGTLKLQFLALVILGTGVVSFLGGLRYTIPALAFFVLAFLANTRNQFDFGAEYPALLGAFLFVGLVEGAFLVETWLGGRTADQLRQDIGKTLLARAAALTDSAAALAGAGLVSPSIVLELRKAIQLVRAGELASAEITINRVAGDLSWIERTARKSRVPVRATRVSTELDAREAAGYRGHRARSWRRVSRVGLWASVFLAVLVAAALANPIASWNVDLTAALSAGNATPNSADQTLDQLLALVPPEASVLTTEHIFPHVSQRPNAYVTVAELALPSGETYKQYVDEWVGLSDYVVLDYQVDARYAAILGADANLTGFGVLGSAGGGIVFERGWDAPPTVWTPEDLDIAGGDILGRTSVAASSYSTGLGDSLYHAAGGSKGTVLWTGPRTPYLPTGTYSVTYDMELLAPTAGPQLNVSVLATPVVATDSIVLTLGSMNVHSVGLSPQRGANSTTILSTAWLNTSSVSSSYDREVITQNFTLASPAYVSFEGLELSKSMSVYLAQVDVRELNPLT